MLTLAQIRKSPGFQSFEDAFGALALFVMLYAGLTLTGTA